MTDLLLRIEGKFTASIPLLIKPSLMKCVLASVLRISLRTGLNYGTIAMNYSYGQQNNGVVGPFDIKGSEK